MAEGRAKFEDFGFINEQISMDFSAYKARKTVFRAENRAEIPKSGFINTYYPKNKILNHNRIIFDITRHQ